MVVMAAAWMVIGPLYGQISFGTTAICPLGSVSDVVAIGDMDADGRKDVVIATGFMSDPAHDYRLNIFLQGENGLDPDPIVHSYPAVFPGIGTMAVGDVDHDGLDDVVIGLQDRIGIFHQNDDHSLAEIELHTSGNGVDGIAIGDVDNDGLNDIVVSHWNEANIKVFHQVAGGFTTMTYPKPLGGYDEIGIGDMDGDGLNDVVFMSGQLADSGLHVFLQGPEGTLNAYVSYRSPSPGIEGWLHGFAIGDLNGDGLNDLVASEGGNQPGARIGIWYQDPATHTFPSCVLLDAYQVPAAVEVADLDCDGRAEIIVGHHGWSAYSVHTQNDQGQFGPYEVFTMQADGPSHPQGLAVDDLDGDGRKDVVTANWQFGLGWTRNTSAPQTFGSIEAFVHVDTLSSDTLVAISDHVVYEVDTVEWAIIGSWINYPIADIVRVDTIRTDSGWVRYGTICGSAYMDTLHQFTFRIMETPLSVDSLPPVVILMDTLNLGIEDRSEEWFSIVPNPSPGLIEVRGVVETLLLEFRMIDANGRLVGEGTMSPPFRLDLSELPNGRYSFIAVDERSGRLLRRALIIAR